MGTGGTGAVRCSIGGAQVELPSLLGVDLTHCEAQAARAVKQSGGSLLLVQAELFTASYFDNLAVEVNELLQARPHLSVL